MRIEVFLLCATLLVGVLCLVGTVKILLLETRARRRWEAWERSPRLDTAIRPEQVEDLHNEIRDVLSELTGLRASVREALRSSSDSADLFGVPLVKNSGKGGVSPQSKALSLEEVAWRLVEECDAKPVERLADVPDWVRVHGYRLESIAGGPEDWFLAVLTGDSEGLVVPNMRRPMGRIDLSPFFDFVDYNGVDPLRGEKVGGFARVTRAGSGWSVTKKGVIHG
jgi:hypothetical protein